MNSRGSGACPNDAAASQRVNDPMAVGIQRSGVVAAMVGLLTALPETRLHRRLMSEQTPPGSRDWLSSLCQGADFTPRTLHPSVFIGPP